MIRRRGLAGAPDERRLELVRRICDENRGELIRQVEGDRCRRQGDDESVGD
jgi:hypothetical protein